MTLAFWRRFWRDHRAIGLSRGDTLRTALLVARDPEYQRPAWWRR